MDIPLPFGLVRGRLYAGVGDTSDVGRAPDLLGLVGTAKFVGTITKRVVTTPGSEMIIVPQAITAQVLDGVLMWQDEPDVPLTANLDENGDSLGWQWKVSFTLTQTGGVPTPVVLPGWTLDVKVYDEDAPEDEFGRNPTLTYLVDSAPVDIPSTGVVITKGDKGDPGPAASLSIGTVTSGVTPSATITGTAPDQELSLVLPKGDTGAKGDTGDTAPSSSSGTSTQFTVGSAPATKRLTLGAATVTCVLPAAPSATTSFTYTLVIIQDAGGNRTVSWPAGIKWPYGLKPALSTAPNAIDVVHLLWTGANWLGFVGGLALA